MRVNERLLPNFDWVWFLGLLLLAGAGLLAIWSTTEGTGPNSYLGRQSLYLCMSLLCFLVLLYFDYHVYSDFITLAYVGGIVVLAFVLIAGHSVHSNKSWLSLGPLAIQPSELIKVVVIVALAKYYSESEKDFLELPDLLIGGLVVGVPMILVMLQGDLGTAITFPPVYAAMSFLGGLRRKHVLTLMLAVVVAAPLGWMMLKDYQKSRIETVLNPSSDPQRMGYQTIQSKIALGSGRFLGKGFKQGTQGQLGFLPARHTDFVFAVLGEERGFAGSAAILILFLFVSVRLVAAGKEAKDKLGSMIIVGVLSLFLFHIVINIGMVVGLLPIAGIPLPFVSAGGSSLLSFFAAMGLCMNIRLRRYVN